MATRKARTGLVQDDLKTGERRGRQLAVECAAVLGYGSSAPKVPPWVVNAWRQFLRDFFGIESLPTKSHVPPRKLAKQVVLAQFFINELRSDPFPLKKDQKQSVDALLDFLEGANLGVIHQQLGHNNQDSTKFFAAFAKQKEQLSHDKDVKIGRSTALTYLWLIVHWEKIAQCQTSTAAFAQLEEFGVTRKSDFAGFKSLCRRIDLRFRSKGRPRAKE